MSKARLDRQYGPFSNFARFFTIEEQFLFTFRLPSPKEVIPFLKEEDTCPPHTPYCVKSQATVWRLMQYVCHEGNPPGRRAESQPALSSPDCRFRPEGSISLESDGPEGMPLYNPFTLAGISVIMRKGQSGREVPPSALLRFFMVQGSRLILNMQ